MIVAAAIRFGDLVCHVPKPGRHHNVLRALRKYFGSRTDASYEREVQGFITDRGEFLGRREAYAHAIECGQGTPRRASMIALGSITYDGQELFSEDLW